MKKKIIVAFVGISMLASVFTGCGNKEIETGSTAGTETSAQQESTSSQTEPTSEENLDKPTEPDETGTETEQEETTMEHNYAPEIDDGIKDEVLKAYQEFMDENGGTQCAFIGMDNAELPLLVIKGDKVGMFALYSEGTVTACSGYNTRISQPGKLVHEGNNEDGNYEQDFYEILDGKIILRASAVYEEEGIVNYDADGNEIESLNNIWEKEYPVDFESIYEQKYIPFDEGGGIGKKMWKMPTYIGMSNYELSFTKKA